MPRYKELSKESREILDSSSIEFVCKLEDILKERDISQTDFSILTGLRPATIGEMIADKKFTINKEHLQICMLVLKLTNLNQLYEIRFNSAEELTRMKTEYEEMLSNKYTKEQEEILRANPKSSFNKKKKA